MKIFFIGFLKHFISNPDLCRNSWGSFESMNYDSVGLGQGVEISISFSRKHLKQQQPLKTVTSRKQF